MPPPPLNRWQSTWRYLVALLISGLTWIEVVDEQAAETPWLWWLELVVLVVAFVIAHYRRRFPLPVVITLSILASFFALGTGPAALALVSLSTRRLWREIIPAAVVSFASGAIYSLTHPVDDGAPWWLLLALNLLATGVLVAIGLYVGARRELVANLRERAERAETEQAMRVAQARTNERARIAREMHDVLAHRISLVAMHAGALAYRSDLSPEETARVAGIIQDTAHRALTDLREVLGVLRDEEQHAVPEQPQPTLRDLDSLLDDERRAGARIRLRNRAAEYIADLPDSIGRNAYRILQESLTNARKHAPHTLVDVIVAGKPGKSLILVVHNPLPIGSANGTPGAGARTRRARRTSRAERWPARPPHHSVRPVRCSSAATMAGVTPDESGQTSPGIRVVLVDDDPLVRAGLSMILEGAPDIVIVGEAGNGAEALDVVRDSVPDVVLMDIRMPRMDGLEATRRLVARPSGPQIIVLTTFDADEYVARALADGASGFLLKDTRPEDIVDGVRRVARGEPILSPSVTAQLIRKVTDGDRSDRSTEAQALLEQLSEREREVAVAVGRGSSNAEIAAELYMSVATVKAHVSRVMDKLGAANRVQIAMRVHDAGLV